MEWRSDMKSSIQVINWGGVFLCGFWALTCLSDLAFIAYNSKVNPDGSFTEVRDW